MTTSQAGGASILLQKGNALVYCFAAETPTSPTVATNIASRRISGTAKPWPFDASADNRPGPLS
jgi:hypothetical protein